jgi:hypothetical protein
MVISVSHYSNIVLVLATLALSMIANNIVRAQGYTNITESSGVDAWCDGLFGNGSSVYDFDNDGWDDITLASSINGIKFYRNLGDGTFELLDLVVSFFGDPKSVIWVDYDNDADNDLLVSGFQNVRLFNNSGDLELTDVTAAVGIVNGTAKSAGASFGDVNNDGWLDLYICRYEQVNNSFKNILYVSDQAGNFADETDTWGVSNGFQPSFQSTFFDVDRDGDQDLFVINDRDTFTNTFYRNDGGYFTNVSGFYNIDYDMWSMSNTIDDLNNDGYPDVYVTNTISGNALFINQGQEGVEGFVDQTESYAVAVNAFCWASAFTDYDNDGLKDLWVLSEPYIMGEGDHYLFHNNGTSYDPVLDSGTEESLGRSFSMALGDFNNDGRQDVVTHSTSILGTEVWQNDFIGGNYLNIDLKGSISNRPGIGTYIDVYSSNGMSTGYILCGENYLGQNSSLEHFGLGEAEIADSILVNWPSGHIDRWYSVPVNQKYIYPEGSSLYAEIFATKTQLCEGEEIILYGGDWHQYLWSTGDTTSSIVINEPGMYSLTTWTNLGLSYSSPSICIEDAPILDINANVTPVSCFGLADGSISLIIDDLQVDSLIWSNGDYGTEIVDLNPAEFSYHVIDSSGCSYFDTLSVQEPSELQGFYSLVHPTCFGAFNGQLLVDSITGGNGGNSISFEGINPMSIGAGVYEFTITDSLNCSWSAVFEIFEPAEVIATTSLVEGAMEGTQTIELGIEGGTPPYSFLWSPNNSVNSVLENVFPGEYSVLITDSLNCTLEEFFTLTSIGSFDRSQLLIYPNPTHSEVQIKGVGRLEYIHIHNALGQLISSVNNAAYHNSVLIETQNLTPGLYYMGDSNGQMIGTFIKE